MDCSVSTYKKEPFWQETLVRREVRRNSGENGRHIANARAVLEEEDINQCLQTIQGQIGLYN